MSVVGNQSLAPQGDLITASSITVDIMSCWTDGVLQHGGPSIFAHLCLCSGILQQCWDFSGRGPPSAICQARDESGSSGWAASSAFRTPLLVVSSEAECYLVTPLRMRNRPCCQ